MQFVTVEEITKVINACPDWEWRLVFALAWFGGLRTPSETGALRWADIDWDGARINIRAAKIEHHEGKAQREIPLFRELLPHLLEAFEIAEPEPDRSTC